MTKATLPSLASVADDGSELMGACRSGDVMEVQRLLKSKEFDVNERDDFGDTCLMVAVTGGHRRVVQELLKAGANVNARGADGKTPLEFAKEAGDKHMIELLE